MSVKFPVEGVHMVTGVEPLGAIVSALPLFVFAHFRSSGPNDIETILCVNRSESQGFVDFEHYCCSINTVTAEVLIEQAGPGFSFVGTSVGTFTHGIWYTAAFLFRNNSFRKVWLGVGASAEDTVPSSTPLVGDTQIGARVIGSSSAFRDYNGCMKYLAAWNAEPSDSEIAALLSKTALPEEILSDNRILYLPELTPLTANVNLAGDDYVVHHGDGTLGDTTLFLDCADEPEIPSCAPPILAADCSGPPEPCGDFPVVEPDVDTEWPFDLLQPRRVSIKAVKATLGGGPSLSSGSNDEATGTANGFWRFALSNVPVRSRAQVLRWRALEACLDGRGGTIRLHIYDGKRAPWATVGDPIVASAGSEFVAGGTSGSVKMTSGGSPRPGMHFSAGDRLYRLKTVGTPSGVPPVYPVTVWPAVRGTISLDDPLEFTHPVCRCRLREDKGMAVELDLLRYADASVEFEEDI